MGAAAGFDAAHAFQGQHAAAAQKFGVLLGVDVVGDDGNLVTRAG